MKPDDAAGAIADNQRKPARMKLKAGALKDKAILDIGCTDGWFCHWAREQGASRVVGLDLDEACVNLAIQAYGQSGIEFRHQRGDCLPEGPFDIVFWMNTMQHERVPGRLLEAIKRAISPTGLLVLECGVVEAPGRAMVRMARHSDVRLYPTIELLMKEFLRGYAVRRFYERVVLAGDPVPRDVFHCTPRLPIVNIVRGASGDGKTFFVQRHLSEVATKTYSLDSILTKVANASYHHSALEKAIKDNYNGRRLISTYEALEQAGHAQALAALLADMVSVDDELVVFEGYMSDAVCDALSLKLSAFAVVWHTARYQGRGGTI